MWDLPRLPSENFYQTQNETKPKEKNKKGKEIETPMPPPPEKACKDPANAFQTYYFILWTMSYEYAICSQKTQKLGEMQTWLWYPVLK
jgi:hypothetical protein